MGMPANQAIALPATKAAIRGKLARWWIALIASIACGPAFVVLLSMSDKPHPHKVHALLAAGGQLAGVVCIVGITLAGSMIWIGRRTRKALRNHPWTVWPIRYVTDTRYEWVTLLGPNGEDVSQLIVSSWLFQIGKLVNHDTTHIWFAGDPHKYGVISPPGGSRPRHAYVPRTDIRKPPAGPQSAHGRHAAN